MSDIDHFIEEVTEEVRRDRLFALYKRYGWIAALLVVLLVGGAAFIEYRKAQAVAEAQRLGDDLIAALAADDAAARAAALIGVEAETPGAGAVVQLAQAAALADSGQTDAAVVALETIAANGEVAEIYRQIAAFKALTLQADSLPADDRRLRFEALARPGTPLRLLAEEQLALIDVSEGETEAALTRLQAILQDAETGRDLQQRASQLIVALGGTPQPPPGNQQG
ncbi:MAG: hypothetical protein KDK02_04375 [Rhodobacteraceae bacterium]|nr:hypothetical protein [Paracoccaceae bacterium]